MSFVLVVRVLWFEMIGVKRIMMIMMLIKLFGPPFSYANGWAGGGAYLILNFARGDSGVYLATP